MDLTILIPTMNRHEFLARALEYYKSVDFKGHIIIGDSSEGEQLQKNKDSIAFSKQLNIIHRLYSNPPYLHSGMCIQEMNKEISTNYAVYQGDDDLFIPSGLQQCIDFLEQSPDEFVAAGGKRCCLGIVDDKPYGDISFVATQTYKQEYVHDDFCYRWQSYIERSWSSQYCVHRTEIWKKMYKKAHIVPSRYWGAEFLPCSLSAIFGKIRQLDCASLVYQYYTAFREQTLYDDMYVDGWALSMRIVKQILIDNGIDPDIVYAHLWFHVGGLQLSQYSRRYEKGGKSPKFISATEILNGIEMETEEFDSWSFYKNFVSIFKFLTRE